MIITKAAFLEGQLFSSQSELLENFSTCSEWWIKAGLSKTNQANSDFLNALHSSLLMVTSHAKTHFSHSSLSIDWILLERVNSPTV